MLWDAEDRSGFASTAGLLVALLRVTATLGIVAAVISIAFLTAPPAMWLGSDLSLLLRYSQAAVVVYVAVVFFRWLATACSIARDVAAEDFEFFPHGAVASFFIPFVNLVLPYRIVKLMCHVSRRACQRGVVQREGIAVIVPAQARAVDEADDDVVEFWWASLLTMLFSLAVAVAAGSSPIAPLAVIGADLALFCAAVAAQRLVRTITDAQLPAVAA